MCPPGNVRGITPRWILVVSLVEYRQRNVKGGVSGVPTRNMQKCEMYKGAMAGGCVTVCAGSGDWRWQVGRRMLGGVVCGSGAARRDQVVHAGRRRANARFPRVLGRDRIWGQRHHPGRQDQQRGGRQGQQAGWGKGVMWWQCGGSTRQSCLLPP